MNTRRLALAAPILAVVLFAFATTASADPKPQCPAPVQTCGEASACPDGTSCRCVPSCPNCRDCAAQVCVPSGKPKLECRTACDCDPGLGCFDGKCIAGIAPVYCCDGNQCPAGDMCQGRSGRMGQCLEPVERCDLLQEQAQNMLARVLTNSNRCNTAADCVRVETSTRCQGTCGAWVHYRRADMVRRTVGHLDRGICAVHERNQCPYATPRCINESAACVEGRCQGVPPAIE